MTRDEASRIHERLDELVANTSKIEKQVAVVAAGCRDCRPKVMGNGDDGLDKRVDRLEQSRMFQGKAFWAGVVLISSIVSGVIVTIASAAVRLAN